MQPDAHQPFARSMMPFVPNALCFGETHPASGTPCAVNIERDGLTLTFAEEQAGRRHEAVRFSDLSVSSGGLEHDHLVVKWSHAEGERTLYLKDAAIIRAFRQAAPDHLQAPFEQAAQRVRQARRRRRLLWMAVVGAVVTLGAVLWFGSDWLVGVAVDRIPIEWEQKLGESAYQDFIARQEVVREGPAVAALMEMTGRLTQQIPDNPYAFEVTLVKSDVVNAFALPGGHIVVFTGLMKKAQSGEEVAGVLGHELNHVLQRHGLERIVKNLGLMTIVAIAVGDQQGLIGLMRQVGVELLTLQFGRTQETEADLTGLRLLHRAKIDPQGMIVFFRRLAEQESGRIELLSTHPMSTARAERLRAEAAKLPKTAAEPFTFEWSAVQASLGVHRESQP